MHIAKAIACFQKHGCNCAQSIAAAFDADPAPFATHGSGRAPGGWCGAAYAAAQLSGNPDVVAARFQKAAGAVTCREIRQARALSCLGCVEMGAQLLKELGTAPCE